MSQPVKRKILIVEDEVSILRALHDELTNNGFIVLEAKNGQEGLEIALREHPDLILLDIVMPVMDGIAMLDKLRDDAWGENAQVIILTNLSDAEKARQAMVKGSYAYLVKSDWKLEEVAAKVSDMLSPLKDKIGRGVSLSDSPEKIAKIVSGR